MLLKEMTKEEVVSLVEPLLVPDYRATKTVSYLLDQLLYCLEQKVIKAIRNRQSKISGLRLSNFNRIAVWGDKNLTPGCAECLQHGLTAIRATTDCNLNCNFCYYKDGSIVRLIKEHYLVGNRNLTAEDLKLMFTKKGRAIKAICWVYKEPLLELDKHLELIEFFHNLGIYQHLYTNGVLATEKTLKILSNAGLDEIRFNLAATTCSDKVITSMKIAKKYFPYVCIESPMFKQYFEAFVAKKKKILNTGVDQITCAELHLGKGNLKYYISEDLYVYKYGYVSPISSRHFTYDLLEIAEKEKWKNVIIHDCSNEVKFFRGISDDQSLNIKYLEEMGMPYDWFLHLLNRYDFNELKAELG